MRERFIAWSKAALPVCVLGFSFFLPITIGVAEGLAFLSVLMAALLIAGREADLPPSGGVLPAAGLFVVWAALSLAWSAHPEMGAGRLHRLLLPGILVAIPVGGRCWAAQGRGPWVGAILAAFLIGAGGKGVSEWFRISQWVSRGNELFHAGTMRDPQMFFAALCVALALLLSSSRRAWRPFLTVLVLVFLSGLLLHGKRGAWLATGVAVAVVLCGMKRARWVVVEVAAIGLMLAVPLVRERLAAMASLADVGQGGRMALWTEAAPPLLSAFPWGVGWCAVTHASLAEHTSVLQANLDHLHSTPLQVALEVGWLGLILWLVWMVLAVCGMVRNLEGEGEALGRVVGVGILAAFVGLLVNGLVEYNFGDTEILMLYCFLMGAAIALREGGPASESAT